MARITTMRDDEHKATMVTLEIKAEEMFTDEFRSWLENLLICVIAKNMASGNGPQESLHEYTEHVVNAVVKAAIAMAHKVGEKLTCDDNVEESFRRLCELVGGGGEK